MGLRLLRALTIVQRAVVLGKGIAVATLRAGSGRLLDGRRLDGSRLDVVTASRWHMCLASGTSHGLDGRQLHSGLSVVIRQRRQGWWPVVGLHRLPSHVTVRLAARVLIPRSVMRGRWGNRHGRLATLISIVGCRGRVAGGVLGARPARVTMARRLSVRRRLARMIRGRRRNWRRLGDRLGLVVVRRVRGRRRISSEPQV